MNTLNTAETGERSDIQRVAHPDDAHLMNYILGRETDQAARSHLAGCARCQKRMAALEDGLIDSAKEREAESYNFKIQNQR